MTNAEAKAALNIAPDAKEVFGKRTGRFIQLAGQLREISEAMSQLDKEKKELTKALLDYWGDCEYKTIMMDGAKVTRVASSNSHVSKELLLEKGVAATVIVACTKVSNYEYIKVTAEKE